MFVNLVKRDQAKNIVDAVNRVTVPKTVAETKMRDRFAGLIKDNKVKKEDQVEFIYTRLGGLMK